MTLAKTTHAVVTVAHQILPTDLQLFGAFGFIILVLSSLIGFFIGLKLMLGPKRRLGRWIASVSGALLAGITVVIVFGMK
jgi:hypothetical protein